MVWLALSLAVSFSAIPRVVPLRPYTASFILNVWRNEAAANEDIERMARLKKMAAFERHSTRNKGTIAVVIDRDVRAIAQLTQPPLTLVDIETSHMHSTSGTLLLKAICATAPDLHLAPTLNERWRIAHTYLRDDDDISTRLRGQ